MQSGADCCEFLDTNVHTFWTVLECIGVDEELSNCLDYNILAFDALVDHS